MNRTFLIHSATLLLVSTLHVLGDPAYSDSFEGATLNPFWTTSLANGTILPSTAKPHAGQQSLQMARTTYGQLGLSLKHTFSAPQYGTVSVYFYDDATRYGFYSSISLGNTALGLSCGIGIQDWDAAQYYYSAFNGSGGVAPGIARSVGWHLLALTLTPTNQTLSFDGQTIYSGVNTAGFDTVTLTTSGPSGSGAYFYDDFAFTPLSAPSPVDITSLKANGALTWTNLPAFSNALFSVEWAPNLTSGWRKSWGCLGGLLATGLTSTVEVPMFFRVKATPNPLLPLPVDQQMTYLVSNSIGTLSTQQIAVLSYARPLANTNDFALLQQDNYRPGFMLMRSTDTAAYRYSPATGTEVQEFQLGPVGTTWTNFNYEGSSYDCKVTLEALENVTVPAGTFPCYKFHKQTLGVPDSDRYEWICPGVGFVKWVDYWVDYTQNPPITYQLQSAGPRRQ